MYAKNILPKIYYIKTRLQFTHVGKSADFLNLMVSDPNVFTSYGYITSALIKYMHIFILGNCINVNACWLSW